MESKSDAEPVHLARAGNRDAYDELIRRYQHSIWGLACLLVQDPFEAEDMTQEAFLRAWRNLDLLSDPAKFGAWLRRIVFGVPVDWFARVPARTLPVTACRCATGVYRGAARDESAFERLQAIELRQRIWDAIERLPPHYRLPLTLFHLDGLSYGRVAEALGIPASTAQSLVTRARQRLRPMLATYAGEVLPELEDVLREQTRRESFMLHITDGESVAGTLRESGIPGDVTVYGDLMYEGPAPAGLDADAWLQTRASWMAGPGGVHPTLEGARQYLRACENTLAGFSRHEEVVIWVDHRLSDQLILIKVLDWFSRQSLRGTKLSLICVGRYAGVDHFVGLGQLNPNQLMSLAYTRLAIGEEQYRTAQTAWNAFTSSDPRSIERFIESDTSALPFIATALRRHLEQFPSLDNGLSRTERQALSVLRNHDSLPGPRLFVAVQRMEEQIFMGHESFNRIVGALADARHPLVEISDTPQHNLGTVRITEAGRRVMQGEADHIALNGINEWLGGVHLEGEKSAWRWDCNAGRIISL
jgi:RNA polymerase sigma factor (sigma-70 family)